MNFPIKRITLFCSFLVLIILVTHYLYYPKWTKSSTEATISWDVSGYYMYLPAAFIYKDLKKCKFYDELRAKYNFTPDFQQAFLHEKSGNYVMKYSIGQALQFSPFFLVAHGYASTSPKYEADGFSRPYQFMISFGSIIIALLGLLFMYKSLREYFDETVVSISLLLLLIGTNYLNYSAIDGAMPHNNLFTIYAILIFATIRLYQNPSFQKAILIGSLVALASLTRPTEIISCLIPIFWGLNVLNRKAIQKRIEFFTAHRNKLFSAILACLLIGSLQFIYWYYVTGEWVVYSYQEQGFSWLRPHLWEGFFSYRSGWLVYSPLMIFSLVGFWFLYTKRRSIFFTVSIFSLLFIYITFAWDIWWYGGSLGQRAMVQAYPILLFPLTSWVEKLVAIRRPTKYLLIGSMIFFVYLNLWFTHQAHRGGLLHAGMMTKAYYWKTLGTYAHNSEDLKLLDMDEYYEGQRTDIGSVEEIFSEEILLSDANQYSESFNYKPTIEKEWIRASADFSIELKEWDVWRMTQMIVIFKNHDEVVKQKFIRIQRHLNDNQTKRIFMDVEYPSIPITNIEVLFWNGDGSKKVRITNIKLELFNER
ncbi:MAG: hypothetical protein ACI9FN_001576 [Saprospiraceae bacterium]|jgi:hypothetical protein